MTLDELKKIIDNTTAAWQAEDFCLLAQQITGRRFLWNDRTQTVSEPEPEMDTTLFAEYLPQVSVVFEYDSAYVYGLGDPVETDYDRLRRLVRESRPEWDTHSAKLQRLISLASELGLDREGRMLESDREQYFREQIWRLVGDAAPE